MPINLSTITHYRYKTAYLASIVLVILSLFGAQAAWAQKLSPAEAAASAKGATGGKVLKVKLMKGPKPDYRVKMLLPEGRVRHIIVDGDSGKVRLRPKGGSHSPQHKPSKGHR